eukprot:1989010-Pleurochrysis_carterae.AAC.2
MSIGVCSVDAEASKVARFAIGRMGMPEWSPPFATCAAALRLDSPRFGAAAGADCEAPTTKAGAALASVDGGFAVEAGDVKARCEFSASSISMRRKSACT